MKDDKTRLVKELRKTIKELAKNEPEVFDKEGNELDEPLTLLKKKAYKLLKLIVS